VKSYKATTYLISATGFGLGLSGGGGGGARLPERPEIDEPGLGAEYGGGGAAMDAEPGGGGGAFFPASEFVDGLTDDVEDGLRRIDPAPIEDPAGESVPRDCAIILAVETTRLVMPNSSIRVDASVFCSK